ncbi:MAG TPA: phage tail sheath subtilisin-like domain-containing protein [Chloroflexia bacterium]|nr:phage tail sheath subtilisin-like domain-containing protein [Chloroflexia bacterium]
MATTYLTPGVYVEEVDKGSKPIEGVGTAVAAFVGFAERGPISTPTFIANWTQFTNTFGSFIPGGYLAHAVYGFFNNGGSMCYITRLPLSDADLAAGAGEATRSATRQLPAGRVELPAKMGGGTVSLEVTARDAGTTGSAITLEVQPATAPEGKQPADDEFTLVVRQGTTEERYENVSLRKDKRARNVAEVVNADSKLVRVAEREQPGSTAERMPNPGTYPLSIAAEAAMPAAQARIGTNLLIGDASDRSGVNGLEVAEDATMVCFPDLMALYQAGRIDMEGVQAVQQAMLDHAQNMGDRVAILDAPPDFTPQRIRDWRMKEVNYDSKYGTLYYPWIKVANPLGNGSGIFVPPCGHMAGIWSRSDSQRGVHKAPANEVIAGCIGLQYQTTHNEQAILNPAGINVIRSFPGRGIRVWGARTISSDPSWRYLNVRRLFNYIEESLLQGTQWAVFEPNDMDLWERIKRDISAFLIRTWRDGALFGNTAAEAFYVKCDAENNPPETRDVGQLIVEVGIAPVKPAEFVIIRLSQWQSGGSAGE